MGAGPSEREQGENRDGAGQELEAPEAREAGAEQEEEVVGDGPGGRVGGEDEGEEGDGGVVGEEVGEGGDEGGARGEAEGQGGPRLAVEAEPPLGHQRHRRGGRRRRRRLRRRRRQAGEDFLEELVAQDAVHVAAALCSVAPLCFFFSFFSWVASGSVSGMDYKQRISRLRESSPLFLVHV